MKKLLYWVVNHCYLHDYEYCNLVTNPERWDYGENYHEFRVCKKCGKVQAFKPHCLGFNPPEYTYSWHDRKNKKAHFHILNGTLCIKELRNKK